MEAAHDSPAPASPDPAPRGELVVQNGRLAGARRPLADPVTVIGRAEGCGIRLSVQGVNPLHCALFHGPAGLVLQDLQSAAGTLVNGERVTACVLQDGDVITVGPFRFRLRLPPELARPTPYAVADDDKEALRVQAAAVAAQQAALTEEELRLAQRRTALEQQEQQLAAHLEEKRRHLLQIRDEAREARTAMRNERATYEQRVAEVTRGLAAGRREVAEGLRHNQAERQRLLDLRRRMRRRWHRYWAAERAGVRRREADVQAQWRRLEKERERLGHEKAALVQARLRFNGEVEIGKRRLQAGWERLHEEQRLWEERRDREEAVARDRLEALEQREAALAEGRRGLDDERRRWDATRINLEKEAEGLESRIRNHRRKVVDQEQEVARLETLVRELEKRRTLDGAHAPVAPAEERTEVTPPAADLAAWQRRDAELREAEAGVQERMASLEALAGELADKRLALAEQCERLVQAQQKWDQDRAAAAAELDAVGRSLQDQGHALAAREQALDGLEAEIRQRMEEAAARQQHLEGWQARLTEAAAAWEGERDRLLADVHAREIALERRTTLVGEVRQLWEERRRQFLARLRQERQTCSELRQEWATLREDCWRRSTALDEEKRALAERTLALEQYRQEILGKAANPRAAERRLEQLRRRCASLGVSAERHLTRERLALEKEMARLQQHARQLQKQADDVAAAEADLERRRTTWEHEELLRKTDEAKDRQELHRLRAQRDSYEQQLRDVRDELERLARLLFDANEAQPSLGRAA